MIVYLIHCRISGKDYVGQTTTSLEERWRKHKGAARRGSSFPIHCAIRKYGIETFDLRVLAGTDNLPELNALEIKEIKKQGTAVPGGYNLTSGGYGTLGRVASEQTRIKMSVVRSGRKNSPSHCAAMAIARIGRPHPHKAHANSESTRRKISESCKGRIPWNKKNSSEI